MKTKPDCATVRVAGDEACLWSWFSSVQAATRNEHGGRTLEREVDRPLRRAMLEGKAARPLIMSSAKRSWVR
jgi:hypothetical protein